MPGDDGFSVSPATIPAVFSENPSQAMRFAPPPFTTSGNARGDCSRTLSSRPDRTALSGGRHPRGGILRCKSKCNVRHIYLLLRVDFIHRKTVSTLHLSRKKATAPHILRRGFVHKMIVIRRSQGAAVATAAVISRRQLRAPLRPVAPRYRLAVRRLSRQPGDNVRRGASAPRGYPPPPAWITPDNSRVSPVQRPAAPQRCPPGGGT